MKRTPLAVAGCLALAVVTLAAVLLARRTPVLVHLLGEGDCACGDFHAEVTGIAVWNPLRDRGPEDAAVAFLSGLRNGRCSGSRDLCSYALPRHRISDWQLRNRRDTGGEVTLYFYLTKFGVSDPAYNLTGEGAVGVRKHSRGWAVTYYSSYF